MVKVEIMDLTVVCQSFPKILDHQIWRDNMLDTLDRMFDDGRQLIVVSGAEGIGKTTLLTQFSKRHPNNIFSLFIKPTNRLGYDPEFMRLDLCNQIHWFLYKSELRPTDEIDDTFLRMLIFELQKRARYTVFYCIIDGLDDIPEDDGQTREAILDLLPALGSLNFCFLFTGDLSKFSTRRLRGVSYESFPLSMFSFDETIRYFQDLNILTFRLIWWYLLDLTKFVRRLCWLSWV
jgi:hypothetical protein